MDAINALILLAQPSRELLKRPIVIHVLDLDDTGAFFGQAALAELKRAGGQLHGFNIEFRHHDYDWRATALMDELMQDLISLDAVIIAASEGGLFEYGSDVRHHREPCRAPGRWQGRQLCRRFRVTRADELRRRMIAESRFKLFPRGIEGFAPLAAKAGFKITETRTIVWSDQVALLPEPL